jgi:general secretion pathway protein K
MRPRGAYAGHVVAASRQRGVALLVAIILVAIAAMLATAIAWRSSIAARRGTAVFTVAQGYQLALGGEAMASYLLHDSLARSNGVVLPTQSWARPYGPFELDAGATFQAEMEDLSGRFNLNSVVMQANGAANQGNGAANQGNGAANQGVGAAAPAGANAPFVEDPEGVAEFMRLLQSLQIDTQFAGRLVDWIDTDNQATSGGAEDAYYETQQPPHRVPNRTLTSVSELLAMGMDRASYDRLRPFVTALPAGTTLNLCTARAEVLDAIAGTQEWDPKLMAAQRTQGACFPDRATFLAALTTGNSAQVGSRIGTGSQYFRLRAWVTLGTTRFTLYSLLHQDSSGHFRPLLRTFGTE